MISKGKLELENQLAEWLAKLREEKGISQEALALQLGKGQSDITKIERGQKRVSVIELISWMAALDIPFERIDEGILPIYLKLTQKKTLWNRSNEH